MIGPHLEARYGQPRLHTRAQQLILKHAARAHHRADSVLFAEREDGFAETLRHALMKGSRNLRRLSAALPVDRNGVQRK